MKCIYFACTLVDTGSENLALEIGFMFTNIWSIELFVRLVCGRFVVRKQHYYVTVVSQRHGRS
jgi:hypothetical protein